MSNVVWWECPLCKKSWITFGNENWSVSLQKCRCGTLPVKLTGDLSVNMRIIPKEEKRTVMQDWTHQLTFMQQAVLLTAVRGPDGIPKDHIVKTILRWYRRCILYTAFERRIFIDPYEPGGGKFTKECSGIKIDEAAKKYFDSIDEMPHHFHMHLMHAAQIVGYKHPDHKIGAFWTSFYHYACSDMHVEPEPPSKMDARLGDDKQKWQEYEAGNETGVLTLSTNEATLLVRALTGVADKTAELEKLLVKLRV